MNRSSLIARAAAVTGSRTEDVVQEVWFKWVEHRPEVTSPCAWLSRTTTNAAIDFVRRRNKHRQASWEIVKEAVTSSLANELETMPRFEELVDGFTLILRSLSQLERAVFVLRRGFAWPTLDVAMALSRSDVAVRQLNHRAVAHVSQRAVRFPATEFDGQVSAASFLHACAASDVRLCLEQISPEVSFAWQAGGIWSLQSSAHHQVRHGRRLSARSLVGVDQVAADPD